MALNLDNPVITHNKNKIIRELQYDLNQYIASNPAQDQMTKSMMVLLMAASSLG